MPGSPTTEAARSLVGALTARSETLTCAESMTGGLLASTITSVPGASACLESSFITYSITAKIRHLGVDPDLIETHGLYSVETALAMARGAREAAGTHWALAVSGLAGPDGGTAKIPVGTVALALAGRGIEMTRDLNLSGTREEIRESAVLALLNLLNDRLI